MSNKTEQKTSTINKNSKGNAPREATRAEMIINELSDGSRTYDVRLATQGEAWPFRSLIP